MCNKCNISVFLIVPCVDVFILHVFSYPVFPVVYCHTVCVSELKLQLQSSFELDSTPEEEQRSPSPDSPVVSVPDQLVAPADAEQKTPVNEVPHMASPGLPADLVLNSNCPLSETLRDLRLETLG